MYTKKLDETFNIIVNGMPYNTIKGDKYYESTLKQYKEHPELFEVEKEYIKTLEELKKEKILELKKVRDEFKKTIFIKENISLYDIENSQDNQYLLINLLLGIGEFTSEDLELYKSKISSIAKIYDTTKKLIENCNLENLLKKIVINFKK